MDGLCLTLVDSNEAENYPQPYKGKWVSVEVNNRIKAVSVGDVQGGMGKGQKAKLSAEILKILPNSMICRPPHTHTHYQKQAKLSLWQGRPLVRNQHGHTHKGEGVGKG